ncbi:DUF433 domain-containing protein [Thalassospira lucentensis]|uniref:DUF433 domain-containing protein n=1 Tax=Thalassospira lucentensis TaxID=168935 RepID=UPI002943A0D3|nr:DUF433 domain-containing protein [Thalassospira lucentensis]WOI08984.1 DUF433 domain-containing protein [Thalassospira lucentensis]
MSQTELLKPAEAAIVAGVSVRDVNRVIDEHILPERITVRKRGRFIRSNSCFLISFYFQSADDLTAEARRDAISKIHSRFEKVWTHFPKQEDQPLIVETRYLRIDFQPFLQTSSERLAELQKIKNAIVVDAEILGGMPVYAGTRIPVHNVAASLREGATIDEVKEAYPSLSGELIRLAPLYADSHPIKGRPVLLKKKNSLIHEKTTLSSLNG